MKERAKKTGFGDLDKYFAARAAEKKAAKEAEEKAKKEVGKQEAVEQQKSIGGSVRDVDAADAAARVAQGLSPSPKAAGFPTRRLFVDERSSIIEQLSK